MRTVEEIRAERRQLAREHDGRFPEEAAARVDQLIENAKTRAGVRLVELIANASFDADVTRVIIPADPETEQLARLAILFVLQSDAFGTWLRENVAEIAAGFATEMPLSEYQSRLQALEDELVAAEREKRRGPILAQRQALDAELAALED